MVQTCIYSPYIWQLSLKLNFVLYRSFCSLNKRCPSLLFHFTLEVLGWTSISLVIVLNNQLASWVIACLWPTWTSDFPLWGYEVISKTTNSFFALFCFFNAFQKAKKSSKTQKTNDKLSLLCPVCILLKVIFYFFKTEKDCKDTIVFQK